MQNQQLDLNDRLFEQAGNDTQNKYERDAYINSFFNNFQNHFNYIIKIKKIYFNYSSFWKKRLFQKK